MDRGCLPQLFGSSAMQEQDWAALRATGIDIQFPANTAGERGAQLVREEEGHFFLWASCVEELTILLIPQPQRDVVRTTAILGQVWRLLPAYRLRQIGVILYNLP